MAPLDRTLEVLHGVAHSATGDRWQWACVCGGGAGGGKAAASGETRLISVTRANNVAIMLTQFGRFSGHEAICKAIYTGKGLGVELLSLLLQVRRQRRPGG